MKDTDKIRLLEAQIAKINELSAKEDHDAYRSWHKQTELLLKKIQGESEDEVREFHQLDGRSSVISQNEARNIQNRTEAYFRHLKASHSILTGVLEFIKSTSDINESTPVNAGTLDALHDLIKEKCTGLYLGENYAEAVEKGFKVVRDRLRDITTHETGSEAFGKGGLYINGATAKNVDDDFQQAVKFLTMSIDFFRNEKSHTSDSKIEYPIRAYEYLALSSLAMHLLDDAEVRKTNSDVKPSKTKTKTQKMDNNTQEVKLDPLQILSMRVFGAMEGHKELLVSNLSGGFSAVHPLGEMKDQKLLEELNAADGQELEANLDQMVTWGLVNIRYNRQGSPLYKLAKGGMTY